MHQSNPVIFGWVVAIIFIFSILMWGVNPARAGMMVVTKEYKEGVTSYHIQDGSALYEMRIYRGVLIEVQAWTRVDGGITRTIMTPNHTIQRMNGKEVLRWNKVGPIYEDTWPEN